MKIYVVAALHGNEKFGLKVLSYLDINSPNMRIRIGHPEAVAKNKRYITTDLNRSFRSAVKTKEALIADAIERELLEYMPDVVIDIHTSTTPVGKVAIVANYSDKAELVARSLGMDNVVIMQKKYIKTALIGCLPDRSVSVEFGRNLRSDMLARQIASGITEISSNNIVNNPSPAVYKVTSTIPKNYKRIDEVVNLELNDDLKAYPFLASKTSYETIGGFLATKIA